MTTNDQCTFRLSPEDDCGEPATATDIENDAPRCGEHTMEVLELTQYGWAGRPVEPRAFGVESDRIAVAVR